MTTTCRTLRIGPAAVMTGDLLNIGTDRAPRWDAVTWIERTADKRGWKIQTVLVNAQYANPRRVTVKRTGPRGLGE